MSIVVMGMQNWLIIDYEICYWTPSWFFNASTYVEGSPLFTLPDYLFESFRLKIPSFEA